MVEFALAWLPLLVVFVFIIAMGRHSMKSYSAHVAHVETINREILDMNRDVVTELREIKQLLKDRG